MSLLHRTALGAATACLLLSGAPAHAGKPVPPTYNQNRACADLEGATAEYKTEPDGLGGTHGVFRFVETLGPQLETPSCTDVLYGLTLVDDSGAGLGTPSRLGDGSTSVYFEVTFARDVNGDLPAAVCVSGSSKVKNKTIDVAPDDSSCVRVPLDGGPPGLAWH